MFYCLFNKVVEDGGEDDDDEDQPRDISMYLSFMLMFSLCDFIATLLALLADILLFIPRLTYVGWIQILPLILLAFTASTICFMKREVSTRKYLQGGDSNYKNDDMYLRRRMVTDPDNDDDDSGSDDGFYVYTNGFYSNSDKDSQWVHHGRRSTTTIDQTMDIPLEDLHTHEQHTDEFDDDDYNDNEDNDGYVH
ncbi:regulator of ime2 [Scheffersomyces spartinae]|uniref:Regulator of ime2 n=1 Tax=Scheffersomyces spartinae TaxID=45513 RepID=A0A9P8AJR3_9ASCO|nr:regulator of ime2 [Scheffersomyces spartinae]KAG7195705.1 regulator of ime2 [Scheffersomyces spartinae]